jgi:hypothetical protein
VLNEVGVLTIGYRENTKSIKKNQIQSTSNQGKNVNSISPLRKVEQFVITYCVHFACFGSALKKHQIILLAEDLMHITNLTSNLLAFKRVQGIKQLVNDSVDNMEQLHCRFHHLEQYLPTSLIKEIKKHITIASTPKSNDKQNEQNPNTENVTFAGDNAKVVPIMCTNCMDITGTTLLDTGEDVDGLLSLAGDARIFGCELSDQVWYSNT